MILIVLVIFANKALPNRGGITGREMSEAMLFSNQPVRQQPIKVAAR
jgi:hypothetical protein